MNDPLAFKCPACGALPNKPCSQSDGVIIREPHNARKKAATSASPAHLIDDEGVKRCSMCTMAFPDDVRPSMSVAFAEHIRKAHKPGQTTEDVNPSGNLISH
jgi:hypothetical protein